ncbi:MAG: LysR family transcriptional regulator [Bacillota bacterium]
MDFRDLEVFVTITKLGSITAAADYLHLSQPTLSRRIRGLEENLGYELFERVGSKLVLTPAGKVCLERCISFMADMKEMTNEMRLASHNVQTFSIGMVDILAETRFSLIFKDFCKLYPSIDIHLYTAENDKISELVANGEVDLGIKYFQEKKVKNIEQIKIDNEQLGVIAAHNSKYVTEPFSPLQLNKAKWITFPRRDAFGSIIASVQHFNLMLNNTTENNHLEIGSLTAQKKLAEADLGLCLLPLSSVVDEVQSQKLQVVNTPSPEINIPIIALYRVSSPVIELIEIFVDLTSNE